MILTPTHQFPTGTALAPERRQALVAWAVDRDATIIEDDYDAEFRYDRAPVGALQGLAPDRVALIGTVSKSLAPGLRLGWVVCPGRLLEAVTEDKRLSDRGSPTLEQLALATLIESGRYDRHLRRMRDVYGARRDALVADARRARPPRRAATGSRPGSMRSRSCPPARTRRSIVAAARTRGIGLYGMSSYRPSGSDGPAAARARVREPDRSRDRARYRGDRRPALSRPAPGGGTGTTAAAGRGRTAGGTRRQKRLTIQASNWLLSVSRFRPRLAAA